MAASMIIEEGLGRPRGRNPILRLLQKGCLQWLDSEKGQLLPIKGSHEPRATSCKSWFLPK